MNRVYVLKSVAYAAKIGGGKIAAIKDINLLAQGALALFTDNGKFIDAVTAPNVLPDTKDFQVAVGREKDIQVITLPRKGITRVARGNYRAFVKPVITVGNLTIAAGDVGEIFIRVSDISYTSAYNTDLATGSVYKTASMTIVQAVDALVARLNVKGSFVVAAKTGVGPYKVTITPKETGVALSVSIGGLIESNPITTTTASVYGLGEGVDVLQMEKDASVEEGNGNYTEYTQDFYKRNMEALSTSKYNMLNINWEGTHSSPSRIKNVMNNILNIACDNAAVADGGVAPALNQTVAEILSLLALIIPTAFSGATAAETATDSGTATDGIPGN